MTWAPGQHRSRRYRADVPRGRAGADARGCPHRRRELAPAVDRRRRHQLLAIYSLIIATFLGTMGLPHVLVRFYTNPDGRAARRTTVVVLAHARRVLPGGRCSSGCCPGSTRRSCWSTAQTDAAVLLLPTAALGDGWTAWLLGGLVAAGAAAAFLSTSSGLVVSLAGVLYTDVLRGQVEGLPAGHGALGVLPIALALCGRRGWTSPRPCRWCSRWRRPRSARCSCWASGGAG